LIAVSLVQTSLKEEDAQDDSTHPSLLRICQNMIKVLEILLKDQGTIQKKWKNYLSEKERFSVGGQEYELKLIDSINFFKKIDGIEKNLMLLCNLDGLKTVFDILLRAGYLAKNIQLGKNVFIMQNYGAQRVKKVAQMQQSVKNVEIKKGQIALVKKHYKGKMEMMK